MAVEQGTCLTQTGNNSPVLHENQSIATLSEKHGLELIITLSSM